MEELESQNDAQVEGLSAKVRMLKDVCAHLPIPIPGEKAKGEVDYGCDW
jgi:hypothetical protein